MVEHDLAKVGVAGSSPVSRSILFIALLFLLGALPASAQGLALAPGDPAPRLEGASIENRFYTVEWREAKVTLVNFWATWCVPCKVEMPALQSLWRSHRRGGLRVIGVVVEKSNDDPVAAFLKEMGATYPVLFPSQTTQRAWKEVTLLPTTVLVSAEGKILRRYVGADPATVEGMKVDVAALLDGKPMPPQVVPGPDSGQNAKP